MDDTLSPQELEQFNQMKAQEPIDQQALKEEKSPVEQSASTEEAAPQEEAPKEHDEQELKGMPKAIAEERERRRAAEEKLRLSEINQARLDERLNLIQQRLQPPPVQKEIPDPEKDALGALKATAEQVRAFTEFQNQQMRQQQANQQQQAIMMKAHQLEQEFVKEAPDYGAASDFLAKSRSSELAALGYNPMQIQQAMQQEVFNLANVAIQQGKNPAQVVYEMSKQRGYAKTTSIQNAQPMTDEQKLARIAEGQKSNVSLGNVNATPAKPLTSGKDLLAMDDDQFSKWLEKLPAKDRSKYLGA